MDGYLKVLQQNELKVEGNLRQLHQKLTNLITLCIMQSEHADVYRQMGCGKNLWRTKLSGNIKDHLPAVHFFGSEVDVSSKAKFIQRTYKPLSQPRIPAAYKSDAHFFEFI